MAAAEKLAQADRLFLEVRDRLRSAADIWGGHDRANDLLLPRGSQLAEGETTLATRRDELDALTTDFIETSVKIDAANRHRKLRNMRLIAAGFGGLAIASLVMLGLTLWKDAELVKKESEAQLSADRANRGFGIAMQAAATLSSNRGRSRGEHRGHFHHHGPSRRGDRESQYQRAG